MLQLNANPSQTGAPCQGYAADQEGNVEGVLYAKAVSIRWQSTDFVLTSTTKPTAAATHTESTSDSLPEVTAKANSGLTTGAKAGIGVGVTLGVILCLGAALGIFYFRRKRRDSPPRGSDEAENVTGADSTSKPGTMTEVSAAPDQQLAELPTPTYFISELPATDLSSQAQKPAGPVGHVEH
ncbi:hypothetical protein F1880_007687 [Penicillium rolfsii]|nr:hypothetical protein F1880_007687 [Penicillium rolfsii]